jgi:hypothetical protein
MVRRTAMETAMGTAVETAVETAAETAMDGDTGRLTDFAMTHKSGPAARRPGQARTVQIRRPSPAGCGGRHPQGWPKTFTSAQKLA